MSSILIQNVEMPKSCDRCKLRYRHVDALIPYDTCFWTGKTVDPWTFGMKNGYPENCPFTPIQDHGDLIDRSELFPIYADLLDGGDVKAVVPKAAIDTASVIIPADKEDS